MNENKNFYKYYAHFDYLQVFNKRSTKTKQHLGKLKWAVIVISDDNISDDNYIGLIKNLYKNVFY